MTTINIESNNAKTIPSSTSHDCPRKTFHVAIQAPESQREIFIRNNMFTVYSNRSYTIPPFQYCTVSFNVIVQTSIPAVCVLFCEPLMLRLNILHQVNILKTNENYLYITLFNNNNTEVKIDHPGVTCQIVAGHIFGRL